MKKNNKKKKRKGFTLIELLAVILILGIIALIAVPTVNGVIEESREGASESTVRNYLNDINEQVVQNQLDNDEDNDIVDGDYTILELIDLGVDLNGTTPEGNVTIKDGEVSSCALTIDNYNVICNGNEDVSASKKACSLIDTNDNDNPDLGEIIACGKEEFYVMYSDDDRITTLAKYGLEYGYKLDNEKNEYIAIENPSNLQNKYVYGFTSSSNESDEYNLGYYYFSDTVYWKDKLSSYKNNYVYGKSSALYVPIENYKQILIGKGSSIKEARLISVEELENLGCSKSGSTCLKEYVCDYYDTLGVFRGYDKDGNMISCSYEGQKFETNASISTPEWVYSLAYFVGTASSNTNIYGVDRKATLIGAYPLIGTYYKADGTTTDAYNLAIRPVIVFDKSILD